jgi:hypothetical protein
MSWFTLNGIDMDDYIAIDTLKRVAPSLIGEQRNALNGGLREDIAGTKERFTASTVPVSIEIADGIRGLFSDCDSVDWNADTWTERGVDGSSAVIGSAQSKFGGSSLDTTGGTATYSPLELLEPSWTVIGWQQVSSVWEHWIVRSDWLRWKNGVSSILTPLFSTATAGLVFFTTPTWYDDFLFLPFLLPSSWASQVYTAHSAASLVPWHRLRASGSFFTTNLTVRGEVKSSKKIKTGTTYREVLEITMEEA